MMGDDEIANDDNINVFSSDFDSDDDLDNDEGNFGRRDGNDLEGGGRRT